MLFVFSTMIKEWLCQIAVIGLAIVSGTYTGFFLWNLQLKKKIKKNEKGE